MLDARTRLEELLKSQLWFYYREGHPLKTAKALLSLKEVIRDENVKIDDLKEAAEMALSIAEDATKELLDRAKRNKKARKKSLELDKKICFLYEQLKADGNKTNHGALLGIAQQLECGQSKVTRTLQKAGLRFPRKKAASR